MVVFQTMFAVLFGMLVRCIVASSQSDHGDDVSVLLLRQMERMQLFFENKFEAQTQQIHSLQRHIQQEKGMGFDNDDYHLSHKVETRQLGADEDLDAGDSEKFSGIRIRSNKSVIALGPDADVQLVRDDVGKLNLIAKNVTISGSLCFSMGEEVEEDQIVCLSVGQNNQILINDEPLASSASVPNIVTNTSIPAQCIDIDTTGKTGTKNGGYFTGSGAVTNGQFTYADVEDCNYGYGPSMTTQWYCASWGGVAVPTGPICSPFQCNAVNVTAHIDLGGSHPSVQVASGDEVESSLVGTDYIQAFDDSTTSCSLDEWNYIDGFEPKSDIEVEAMEECAGKCIDLLPECGYFSVEMNNPDFDSGVYCRLFRNCTISRDASVMSTVYEMQGCKSGTVPNPQASWICPNEGGIAMPNETICACDANQPCLAALSEADVSGVYSISGYGSDAFEAYIEVIYNSFMCPYN